MNRYIQNTIKFFITSIFEYERRLWFSWTRPNLATFTQQKKSLVPMSTVWCHLNTQENVKNINFVV